MFGDTTKKEIEEALLKMDPYEIVNVYNVIFGTGFKFLGEN